MNYGYTYSTGTEYNSDGMLTVFVLVCLTGIFVWGFGCLVSYVLRGIGFYRIAKSRGDENAWLAFIPFVRKYQQGKLAGNLLLKKKAIRNTGLWFLIMPIAWGVFYYLLNMIMGIVMSAGTMFNMSLNGDMDEVGAGIVLGMIAYIIFLIVISLLYGAIFKLLHILINASIFSRLTTGNMPLIHAVFCAFIPLYEAICVFALSRRVANTEPKRPHEYHGSLDYRMVQEQKRYGEYRAAAKTEEFVNKEESVGAEELINVEEPVREQNPENMKKSAEADFQNLQQE
ncbi:MAG: hypothetical protein U0L05_06040 [Schaedlerella sp.]|nr:hypothetical protein [Schaedlerella sp.]